MSGVCGLVAPWYVAGLAYTTSGETCATIVFELLWEQRPVGALHNVIAERGFRVSDEILNGFTKAPLLPTRDDVEQRVLNAAEVVKGVPGHIPIPWVSDNTNNWALLCLLR